MKKRANYWIVYRNLAGRTIQANTHTRDKAEAIRQLAVAALPALRARVALLEKIAGGKQEATRQGTRSTNRRGSGPQPVGPRQKQSAGVRPVRPNSTGRRGGNR